ncbi:MAG: hypothetical protein HY843_07555 [Bdellovibrio sp.]|nr:hypothetical protein [Bdellovibrio sp.]
MVLKRVRANFKRFIKSNAKGQTTTEYILILFVVVMVALKFRGLMKEKITSQMDTLGTKIEQITNDSE